jgi:hypothetical protein
LVRSQLEKAGIKVVAEGDISGKTIDEKMYIDTHYGAIAAKVKRHDIIIIMLMLLMM